MVKSIGMAIKITKDNHDKLSIMTAMDIPEPTYFMPTYFVFPYDPSGSCETMPADKFFEIYQFANEEDPTCFVDIDRI